MKDSEKQGFKMQIENLRKELATARERVKANPAADQQNYIEELKAEKALWEKKYAHLDRQINDLANYIMKNIAGEPSKNQGAVDTAIRLLKLWNPQNQEKEKR